MIPCGTGYAEPMNSKGFRYAIADLPTTHPDGADRTFDDDELFRIRDVLSRYDGWAVVMREDDAADAARRRHATAALGASPAPGWEVDHHGGRCDPPARARDPARRRHQLGGDRRPFGTVRGRETGMVVAVGARSLRVPPGGVDVVDVVLGSPTLVHAADGRISFDSLEQAA